MKNIFKSIIALVCCGAVFAACQKEAAEAPEIEMSVDVTSLEVEYQNPADQSVALTSNVTWILTAPEWVTASAAYGNGNTVLTFSFETNYKDEKTSTLSRSGEICISGGGSLTGKGVTITIPVNQAGYTYVDPNPPLGGIDSAEELVAFAKAVNAGASLERWQNDAKEIVLLNDINLTGITDWTPIGVATASGSPAYTTDTPFTGVFDGQGHKIIGVSWTYDVTDATSHVFGLFGALKNATVKNVVFGKEGDQITIVGSSQKVIAVGAVLGYAESSTITNVTNYVDVVLADKDAPVPGDNPAVLMMLSGVAGAVKAPMTVGNQEGPVKNYGTVKTGKITNTGNGGTGMNIAGIVAYTVGVKNEKLVIDNCYNYGDVSAPTGRGGGLVATAGGATDPEASTLITNSENLGLIQDDIVGQFEGKTGQHNVKRMGGLVGGTADNKTGIVIDGCINSGNVFSQVGCRTGGFVGHCNATIKNCKNTGVILAKNSNKDHGAGWACGFVGAAGLITGCTKGGRVGDYDTYKDNPETAPVANDENACLYLPSRYDPSLNN